MKTLNKIFSVLLMIGSTNLANAAAPSIDTFNIQSFLKLSNNTAVSATSADFVFSVFKGSTCIWAKRYSAVAINSGVLNQKISGSGSNIASINNASATPGECVSNFSGTTLNSTLLNTGAAAALSIRIYTETTIDTYKPIWDIPLNSAPTAMIADLANTATTATTANDLDAAVKVSTTAGASDNGKFPVLSGSGQIHTSMINQSALTIANTQVSGLGTAAVLNTGTSVGNIPVLGAGGRLGAAQMPTYVANRMLATDGTGVITSGYDTATAGGGADANKLPLLNGSGQLANAMIDSASLTPNPANFSATVPVDKGGTGATTFTSGSFLTGNGTGAITEVVTVPVNKGGTGLTTITTGSLMVGAGTGNVTEIPATLSGNVLSATGATTWVSRTRDAAGLVDKVNTQTGIAGNKTFTGVITHSSTTTLTGATTAAGLINANGGIKVGATGSTLASIFKCSVTVPTGAANTPVACTGATATSVIQCSPTGNLPDGWSLSFSRGSGANQITLRADQASGATGWTSTTFNCVAIN